LPWISGNEVLPFTGLFLHGKVGSWRRIRSAAAPGRFGEAAKAIAQRLERGREKQVDERLFQPTQPAVMEIDQTVERQICGGLNAAQER
jgi:hypothetical protein